MSTGVRDTYGIQLQDNVIILDEAQYAPSVLLFLSLPFLIISLRSNIEDVCRNSASLEVAYNDLRGTQKKLIYPIYN